MIMGITADTTSVITTSATATEEKKTVPASVAMLRVLEAWGVKRIYGYPGGSFNSTMAALDAEKIISSTFRYVTNK